MVRTTPLPHRLHRRCPLPRSPAPSAPHAAVGADATTLRTFAPRRRPPVSREVAGPVRWGLSGIVLGTLPALVLTALPGRAAAQLPSADPGALGLGAPNPAVVRGYGAVAVNPAALGAEDGPAVSATALSLGLRNGLDPVSLGDLADWEGRDVPHRVRERWLEDVVARGSQAGAAGADVTLAALSRGAFGVQLSTRGQGTVSLNPDAAELLLFGNAGLDGVPRDFRLAGSGGSAWLVTTAALGYGRAVGRVAGGRLRLGAALTLSVGHVVGLGRDNGSGLGGDPTELDLRFPVLHVDRDAGGLDHGRGLGLDVGALWRGGDLVLGAAVQNLVNGFSWEVGDLSFRPGSALFDSDDSSTDFDERPASEAPPVLLDALDALTFRRALTAGAAWRARRDLVLGADLRLQEGGGMTVDPDARLGVGAEYRFRPHLPLRAGLAAVERGVQLSGGAGVELGRFTLSGAVALRTGSLDDLLLATLGASWSR